MPAKPEATRWISFFDAIEYHQEYRNIGKLLILYKLVDTESDDFLHGYLKAFWI